MERDEEWRAVVGWEGLYEVSCLGRVRSQSRIVDRPCLCGSGTVQIAFTGKVLRPWSTRGYPTVTLSDGRARKKKQLVHRLVCFAFIGPCPGPAFEVGHRDGDASNAKASNLRWVTPTENAADRVLHGNHNRGESAPWAKITEEDVVRLREAKAGTVMALAAEMGISQSHASHIRRGKVWKHLTD